MLGAKALERNTEFHCRAAVRCHKLVVLQLDDVALLCGNRCRNLGQFSRLIRQKYRHGEDTVAENESLLYHGGHRDDVHVAAT